MSGLHQHCQRWIYCWPKGFIPWLMNLPLFARALVKWLPGACTLARKFHTRAMYSLLIGSLTMLWNNIACVFATTCTGEKQHLDSWACANMHRYAEQNTNVNTESCNSSFTHWAIIRLNAPHEQVSNSHQHTQMEASAGCAGTMGSRFLGRWMQDPVTKPERFSTKSLETSARSQCKITWKWSIT